MNSEQHELTNDQVAAVSDKNDTRPEEEVITDIAFKLWINSQIYKENRMNRIGLYERLYNNELPKKNRQLFNIAMPIFGGFEDALQANLSDPVKLKFNPTNPKDYLLTPKLQAQWEIERDGLEPNQMWNSKAKNAMTDALRSGRAIMKGYAENDPKYRYVLENTYYANFHCQPLGGWDLENHLFCGEEAIYMTKEDILSNDNFPKSQRDKISNFSVTDEWWQQIEQRYGTRFARFKSLGLDIQSNTFTGTDTLMLNQFVITRKGQRFYVLYDPISRNWLQVEKLEDFLGTSEMPWKSAATHPDAQNFWSKSFSDDIFPIALTISTLVNQELTNREKQNFNARAYDPSIFTDEQKLDAAQYLPDRLVPADTSNGVRKIQDGIYAFTTPQLQGTINLVQWLENDISKNVGLMDYTTGQPTPTGGKVNAKVVIQQQEQLAKRIGFRADAFKEMFGRLGNSYIAGLKNFMPASLPVKVLGEEGFTEEAELKLMELKKSGPIGIEVVSTSAERMENQTKKNARVQALSMVAQSPNINSEWRDEQIMRAVGEFTDEEIKSAMDTQTYGSRRMVARASQAIQQLLKGEMPDAYFGADAAYMQYIQDFMTDNQSKLSKMKAHPVHGTQVMLIALFGEYLMKVTPLAQKNMQRKAQAVKAGRATAPQQQGSNTGQTEPGGVAVPMATRGPGNVAVA